MQGYVVAVSIVAGGCVFAVLAYLALRIFKKNAGRSNSDAETTGLYPPRIILTSDSPGQSKKRLYSPARERAASKDREEKLARIKRKEKRRDIKSLWLPKKKTSLPMMQATMVQPAVPEQTKVLKLFFNLKLVQTLTRAIRRLEAASSSCDPNTSEKKGPVANFPVFKRIVTSR